MATLTDEVNGLNTERNQRIQELKMLETEKTNNLEIIKVEQSKNGKLNKDLQKALRLLLKYKVRVSHINT